MAREEGEGMDQVGMGGRPTEARREDMGTMGQVVTANSRAGVGVITRAGVDTGHREEVIIPRAVGMDAIEPAAGGCAWVVRAFLRKCV